MHVKGRYIPSLQSVATYKIEIIAGKVLKISGLYTKISK